MNTGTSLLIRFSSQVFTLYLARFDSDCSWQFTIGAVSMNSVERLNRIEFELGLPRFDYLAKIFSIQNYIILRSFQFDFVFLIGEYLSTSRRPYLKKYFKTGYIHIILFLAKRYQTIVVNLKY